jgi:hypothetical protein
MKKLKFNDSKSDVHIVNNNNDDNDNNIEYKEDS